MKFVKIDTPTRVNNHSSTSASAQTREHSTSVSGGKYMYLDEMLDKTFMTDYFLH
jgi:hypothetical protein